MNKPKCKICGEEVPQKRKDQIFCSTYCRLKHHSRQHYHDNKDNPEYRIKIKRNFKKWYANNKERQKNSILKSYQANKEIWAMRTFNTTYRKKLQLLLPKRCFVCGKEAQEFIGIKDTSDTFRPRMLRYRPEENAANLLTYSKKLVNLCSRECLGKIHRREFSFDGKDGYS